MIADDGWCVYHERVHGPQEFGDLCQAWEDVEPPTARHFGDDKLRRISEPRSTARRPTGWWLKRFTVCWWLHRTRNLGHGTYYSSTCRSCHRRRDAR